MSRWAWIQTVVIVLGAAGIAAFNGLMDPFAIHGAPRIDGFNRDLPLIGEHRRLHKAHRLADVAPEVVVLGSSRAENGIDPEHPILAAMGSGYNAALTDAGIYEVRRMAEHAAAVGEVQLYVVGLDFFQFVANPPAKGSFAEERLARAVDGSNQPLHRFADLGRSLFTEGALWVSGRTLAHQADELIKGQARFLRSGFDRGVDDYVAKHGQRGAIVHKELGEILTRWPQYLSALEDRNRHRAEAIQEFQRLCAVARAEEAAIWCYTAPTHARLVEQVHQLGLEEDWLRWRRDLAAAVDGERARGLDIRLWDFAGFNAVTGEAVPHDGSAMRFYWEGSHFTPEVGGWILERLAGGETTAPAGFGVELSGAAVDAHLAAEAERRAAWKAERPRDAAEIQAVYDFLTTHAENRAVVVAAFEYPREHLLPWLDGRLAED